MFFNCLESKSVQLVYICDAYQTGIKVCLNLFSLEKNLEINQFGQIVLTQLHEPETEGPLAKVRRLEQIIVKESTPSNLTSSQKTPTAQSYSKHQCTFDINPTNLPNISLTQIQQTTCNNSQLLQPTSNLNRTCQSSSDLSPNQQSSSNHTHFIKPQAIWTELVCQKVTRTEITRLLLTQPQNSSP